MTLKICILYVCILLNKRSQMEKREHQVSWGGASHSSKSDLNQTKKTSAGLCRKPHLIYFFTLLFNYLCLSCCLSLSISLNHYLTTLSIYLSIKLQMNVHMYLIYVCMSCTYLLSHKAQLNRWITCIRDDSFTFRGKGVLRRFISNPSWFFSFFLLSLKLIWKGAQQLSHLADF